MMIISFAQVLKAQTTDNLNSYWQISGRVGYDFPTYKHDFKYIKYKGGMMGGLSINKFWNNWGFQIDGDYMKNDVYTQLPDLKFLTYNVTTGMWSVDTYASEEVHKKNITRMFFGAGPAYKWRSASNKMTVDAALMGGLGIIDGGEILSLGVKKLGKKDILAYHSGFDNAKTPTLKAQVRMNYFFTPNFGFHLGAYYMNHFGAKESQKQQILRDLGYVTGTPAWGTYYYEVDRGTKDVSYATGTATPTEGFLPNSGKDRIWEQGVDENRKMNISSIGVFAGLTYRFGKSGEKPKPTVEVCPVCGKDHKPQCCATCGCKITVTARDKFTREVLDNTSVVLTDMSGNVVESGVTNSFGVVTFDNVKQDNYMVKGKLYDVELEKASIAKGEFDQCLKGGSPIQKEILYTDENFIIKGKVVVCNTNTPLDDVNVTLKNNMAGIQKTTNSNAAGEFIFHAVQNTNYSIYGKKGNYFSETETLLTKDYDRNKTLFIKLEMCMEQVDCGKAIRLENILYDLDKYFIRPDAKPELNRLVQFMKDNPSVKVELSSHTDSRASAAYNRTLSQNRANAAVDYIVTQGVERARLVGVGYGESKLLNECADNVKCSEEAHQLNRRTEFKVICPN